MVPAVASNRWLRRLLLLGAAVCGLWLLSLLGQASQAHADPSGGLPAVAGARSQLSRPVTAVLSAARKAATPVSPASPLVSRPVSSPAARPVSRPSLGVRGVPQPAGRPLQAAAHPIAPGVVAPVVSSVVASGGVAPVVSRVVAPVVSGVVAPIVSGVAPVVSGVVAPVVSGIVAPVVSRVVTPVLGSVPALPTGPINPAPAGPVSAPVSSGLLPSAPVASPRHARRSEPVAASVLLVAVAGRGSRLEPSAATPVVRGGDAARITTVQTAPGRLPAPGQPQPSGLGIAAAAGSASAAGPHFDLVTAATAVEPALTAGKLSGPALRTPREQAFSPSVSPD